MGLKIIVFEACELVNKDMIGKSDPFVKIKFNGQEFKSKKVRNSLNPEWNFSANLDVDASKEHGDIILEVFDDDFGSENFIGSYTFSLFQAIDDTDKEATWHKLVGCNTGKISFSTIYSPDEEPAIQLKNDEDSSIKNYTPKDDMINHQSTEDSNDQADKSKDMVKANTDSSESNNTQIDITIETVPKEEIKKDEILEEEKPIDNTNMDITSESVTNEESKADKILEEEDPINDSDMAQTSNEETKDKLNKNEEKSVDNIKIDSTIKSVPKEESNEEKIVEEEKPIDDCDMARLSNNQKKEEPVDNTNMDITSESVTNEESKADKILEEEDPINDSDVAQTSNEETKDKLNKNEE